MIKVLVIDDSASVRMLLTKGLALDPEITVVGSAPDPFVARDKIAELNPDVLTLDVEMPKMDGVEFLRRIMAHHPMPVIMVSALTEEGKKITFDALEAGAFDYVTKPSGSFGGKGLNEMLGELRQKIKSSVSANLQGIRKTLQGISVRRAPVAIHRPTALSETTDKVLAIGASTGGTNVIRDILAQLPADSPGIVVVQHLTPGFSTVFANRLNELGHLQVKEAEEGDRIITGRVLVAPSHKQMRVRRSGGYYLVECREEPLVCGHRPSVEALFQSVAEACGPNAIGVILTGMGNDGSQGLLAMRKAGARTLGQDEASSVVYGMPRVAFELGGVEQQVSLENMAQAIQKLFQRS